MKKEKSFFFIKLKRRIVGDNIANMHLKQINDNKPYFSILSSWEQFVLIVSHAG